MDYRPITEDYSVAGQISADDMEPIKAAGFRSVVCNRPDAEDGAVPHDEIAAAAREAGLEFRYIPVVSGQMTQQNVEDQAAALRDLPRPMLAYCRSGTRSTLLWSLAQASLSMTPNDIAAHAAGAGYDVAPIRPLLDMLAARRA